VSEHDTTFAAMGTRVRLLVGEPDVGMAPAAEAAAEARALIEGLEAALSRFRAGSELCRLNDDPRERVPVSQLMLTTIAAGVEAAERSGGVVDPTLLGEIETAGYARSMVGVKPAALTLALAEAPPRQPAAAHPARRWRRFELDAGLGTVVRPPGICFDSGGIGKGLAADLVADRLRGYARFVVDCGGDVRIGGAGALLEPFRVVVEDPLRGGAAHVMRLGLGAVATSGLSRRIWRRPDGHFAHHLLDPSTGEPAWTGVLSATALADTAVEAEALAKEALLRGPEQGRAVLADRGGVLIHDSGRAEPVGPVAAAHRRLRRTASTSASAGCRK
jgi:FAD:protein FMN transferase